MKTTLIRSRLAMQKLAGQMAREVLGARQRRVNRHATVIALSGELGSGKTTFSQGFLKALGVKQAVISPTFLIIRRYGLKKLSFTSAFHIDCYRIERPEELVALSLKEIVSNPEYIVLIEWPELVKKYLPKDTLWIYLRHGVKKNEKTITY